MKANDYFFSIQSVLNQTYLTRASFIVKAVEILNQARVTGATVWIAGNGGSASTADHFACDLSKSTWMRNRANQQLRVISLAASTACMTAWANDVDYRECFSAQLRNLGKRGDVLLVLSVSGTSPSIVEACREATARGIDVIFMTGLNGAEMAEHYGSISLVVPHQHHGIVEDIHAMMLHAITEELVGI